MVIYSLEYSRKFIFYSSGNFPWEFFHSQHQLSCKVRTEGRAGVTGVRSALEHSKRRTFWMRLLRSLRVLPEDSLPANATPHEHWQVRCEEPVVLRAGHKVLARVRLAKLKSVLVYLRPAQSLRSLNCI